jgi:hypothetical protein
MRRILLIWLFLVLFPKVAASQTCDDGQIVTDSASRTLMTHGPLQPHPFGKAKGFLVGGLGWMVSDPERYASWLKSHPADTYDVWLKLGEDPERRKEVLNILGLSGVLIRKADEAYELSPNRGFLVTFDSCLTKFLEPFKQKLITITFRPEFKP